MDLSGVAQVGVPGVSTGKCTLTRVSQDATGKYHVDLSKEVPSDRWDINAYYNPDPEAPGKIYTRYGGFLSEIAEFDADFFGIAPREAVSMDPQHSLLLEVSWEALENAALVPQKLIGSRTGVFVGITTNDYMHLLKCAGLNRIDAYQMTGNCLNFAAGRFAYPSLPM